MALRSGDRLGPYTITSALAEGGMGEVYRARDTRLNRTVAIKILPEALAADPEFQSRFRREAETIAGLSHPHICVLHDVGDHDGRTYLVMEFLEGESLFDRLRRGPLPIADTLRIGAEIAEALTEAHRRGIVHRDLKPGNVVLTTTGAKLLDFGIAKATVPDLANQAVANTRPVVTVEGTLLGTPHYMAPEQLAGKAADTRTDIFALGAMLYEMAAGRRAFDGDTTAAVIGAIMHAEPSVPPPADSPAPIRFWRVVKKCLAKDPAARWQSARDLGDELRWIAEEATSTADAAPDRTATRRSRASIPLRLAVGALVALAALTVLAAAIVVIRQARVQAPLVRMSIVAPAPLKFSVNDASYAPNFALAPDGRRIAFVAEAPGKPPTLWVRTLDAIIPQEIVGTEGASGPFWSPDGSALACFARGKLKLVTLGGAPPRDVADVAYDVTSGTWNRDGVILFGGAAGSPIGRVSTDGGAVTPVTALDRARKETGHAWPEFLPDGRRFLFFVRSADPAGSGVYLAALDAPGKTQVVTSVLRGVYAPPRHLLFEQAGTLMVQPFDVESGTVTGRATAMDERVTPRYGSSQLPIAVSGTTMAYWFGGPTGGRPMTELQWFDRSGRPGGKLGETARFDAPMLSADGRRVIVTRLDPATLAQQIWAIDVDTGVSSPRTFGPGFGKVAVFSPDGRDIVVSAVGRTGAELNRHALDGGSETHLLEPGATYAAFPTDWTRDGAAVIYQALAPAGGWDLFAYEFQARRVRGILQASGQQVQGRVSPDQKWLAYSEQATGAMNIYVTPFPSAGTKVQVTTDGGSQPVWSRDGKELFYLAADNTLMAVPVRGDRAFEVGKAVRLFATRAPNILAPYWTQYAVSSDGTRFLVNNVVPDAPPTTITVVLNWKP